eukprot:3929920-Alexandrium_andersonii.AAC.1
MCERCRRYIASCGRRAAAMWTSRCAATYHAACVPHAVVAHSCLDATALFRAGIAVASLVRTVGLHEGSQHVSMQGCRPWLLQFARQISTHEMY